MTLKWGFCRDACASVLGELPDQDTLSLLEAVWKLREWHSKLSKASSGTATKGMHVATAQSPPAASADTFSGEFGEGLNFKPPRLGPLPDEAMPNTAQDGSEMAVPLYQRFVASFFGVHLLRILFWRREKVVCALAVSPKMSLDA